MNFYHAVRLVITFIFTKSIDALSEYTLPECVNEGNLTYGDKSPFNIVHINLIIIII